MKNPQAFDFRGTVEQAYKHVERNWKYRTPLLKEYPSPLPTVFKPIEHPTELPSSLRSTIISILIGQAIGDAVGLATEFLDKEESITFYKNEHIRYDNYRFDSHRCRWMNPEGKCADWTDDTDQCILILDSIVRNNGNCDEYDFAQRLYFWLGHGFPEVGDYCPLGVGANVGKVTSTEGWVNNPIEISKKVWMDGGKRSAPNGSVMRTSVASIPYFWDEMKVIENARKYGQVTHYDHRCQASVSIIVLVLAKLLQGRNDVEKIIEESFKVAVNDIEIENQKEDFEKYCNVKSLDELNLNQSIGYTFKPVGCALWCLKEAEKMMKEGKEKKTIFVELLEKVVYEAGDADTNGCVVGAVLGAYLRDDWFPEDWLAFENKEWLVKRINNLLKLYELEPFSL